MTALDSIPYFIRHEFALKCVQNNFALKAKTLGVSFEKVTKKSVD